MEEIDDARVALRHALKRLHDAVHEHVNPPDDAKEHQQAVFHDVVDAEISLIEAGVA